MRSFIFKRVKWYLYPKRNDIVKEKNNDVRERDGEITLRNVLEELVGMCLREELWGLVLAKNIDGTIFGMREK